VQEGLSVKATQTSREIDFKNVPNSIIESNS